MSMVRTRWAALGAAVAVSLGAGGIGLSEAALSSGPRPVFVAISPCRLVDTRPGDANVGGRTDPLGANDTLTLQITGSTGECTGIPADAVAAAMNVTAIQGSTRSYLSAYPADAALPNASNLNWNGGDPPTPNKVDVKLSATGAVKLTNDDGTVHVAADLVGYYVDHAHDDRYYTKSQLDATRRITRTIHGAAAAVLNGKPLSPAVGCMTVGPGPGEQGGTIVLPIDIPTGTTITAVHARVLDGSAADVGYSIAFQRWAPSIAGMSSANLRATSGGAASGGQDVELTPASPIVVTTGQTFAVEMSVEAPASPAERNGLCSVTIEYTLPAP
jgi:hypothetical protein